MVRIRIAPILVFLAIGLPCFAQSNSEVDDLLAQVQARTDSAAYMILVASGQLGEDASPSDAYTMLLDKKWILAAQEPSFPIKVDQYCAIVMRALGLKGGLMYSLFPGPRYAYREFVAKGFVNPSGGPKRLLPGDEVLRILRQALDLKGVAQ